ncbi:MAG: hypothetical protein ABIO81_01570 [Ginsengibacter sp.]
MPKFITIYCFCFSLVLASCKKDTVQVHPLPAEAYSFMSFDFEYMLSSLGGSRYEWKIMPGYYYSKTEELNDISKGTQALRYGVYATFCDAKFEITTPVYSGSEELLNTVLTVGKKQIGYGSDQFSINMIQANDTWPALGRNTTEGPQPGSRFEIVKTKKIYDKSVGKNYLMVWIIFDCKMYRISDSIVTDLKQGNMIAKFYEF